MCEPPRICHLFELYPDLPENCYSALVRYTSDPSRQEDFTSYVDKITMLARVDSGAVSFRLPIEEIVFLSSLSAELYN